MQLLHSDWPDFLAGQHFRAQENGLMSPDGVCAISVGPAGNQTSHKGVGFLSKKLQTFMIPIYSTTVLYDTKQLCKYITGAAKMKFICFVILLMCSVTYSGQNICVQFIQFMLYYIILVLSVQFQLGRFILHPLAHLGIKSQCVEYQIAVLDYNYPSGGQSGAAGDILVITLLKPDGRTTQTCFYSLVAMFIKGEQSHVWSHLHKYAPVQY